MNYMVITMKLLCKADIPNYWADYQPLGVELVVFEIHFVCVCMCVCMYVWQGAIVIQYCPS